MSCEAKGAHKCHVRPRELTNVRWGQGSSQISDEARGAHLFYESQGSSPMSEARDLTNVLWGQGSSQMSGEARGAHKCQVRPGELTNVRRGRGAHKFQVRLGEFTNFRWGQGSSYISGEARGAHKCKVSCHGWDVGKAIRKTKMNTESWATQANTQAKQ
jgi:hypothetical protein